MEGGDASSRRSFDGRDPSNEEGLSPTSSSFGKSLMGSLRRRLSRKEDPKEKARKALTDVNSYINKLIDGSKTSDADRAILRQVQDHLVQTAAKGIDNSVEDRGYAHGLLADLVTRKAQEGENIDERLNNALNKMVAARKLLDSSRGEGSRPSSSYSDRPRSSDYMQQAMAVADDRSSQDFPFSPEELSYVSRAGQVENPITSVEPPDIPAIPELMGNPVAELPGDPVFFVIHPPTE